MEMRIVLPDASSAAALAQRLSLALGIDHIRLGDLPGEVDVVIDAEPRVGIAGVVGAVVRWFDDARVGVVELWLGERSYRLARWVPVERR
jgi:hypothetical protein